jgi:ferric-dicitrate binding protein FerR (iron transport regulator)
MDRFVINHLNKRYHVSEEIDQNIISWYNGKLTFKNTPLEQVIEDIERHFNLEIKLSNPDLSVCTFTSPFIDRDAAYVIQTLARAFDMKVSQEKKEILLIGGTCGN